MLKILNVMVVGLLTIPLSSFGAVITYTSDVFSGSALGGSGVTVSIPQFNPALGNLSYIGYLQVSSIVTAVITVRGSIIPADGTCRDGGALLWLQITSSSSLFINN